MAYPFRLAPLAVVFGLVCASASADFLQLAPAKESGSYEGFLQQHLTQARFVGLPPEVRTDFLRVVFSKVNRAVESLKSESPNEYIVKDAIESAKEVHSRFGNLFYATAKVKAKVTELKDLMSNSKSKDVKKLDGSLFDYLLSLPTQMPETLGVVKTYLKTLGNPPAVTTDAEVDAFFHSVVEGRLATNRAPEAVLTDLSALATESRAQFGFLFNFRPDQIRRVQALIEANPAVARRLASDELLSFLLTPVVFDVKTRFPNYHEGPTLALIDVPTKLAAGQTAKIVFETKDEAGFEGPLPSLYAQIDWDKKQDVPSDKEEFRVVSQVGFGTYAGGNAVVKHVGGDRYETTVTVPRYLRPGRYHWTRFSVSDKFGQRNQIEVERGESKYRRHWQGHSDYLEIAKDVGKDGDLIEVQVENSDADVEPPRLVSLTFEKARLQHGELQTAHLKVTDDKSGFDPKLPYCWGFSRVDASGKHLEGKESGYIHGCEGRELKDDGKGGWVSTFPALRWAKPGRYRMDRMFLQDKAGNLNRAFLDKKSGLIQFPTGESLRPPEFQLDAGPEFVTVTRGPRVYAMEARGTMLTDEPYQFYVKVLDNEVGTAHAGWCGSAPSLATPHGWWTDSLSVCGDLKDAGQGWRSIRIGKKAVPNGRHMVYDFSLSDNRGETTNIQAVTAAKFQVLGFEHTEK